MLEDLANTVPHESAKASFVGVYIGNQFPGLMPIHYQLHSRQCAVLCMYQVLCSHDTAPHPHLGQICMSRRGVVLRSRHPQLWASDTVDPVSGLGARLDADNR